MREKCQNCISQEDISTLVQGTPIMMLNSQNESNYHEWQGCSNSQEGLAKTVIEIVNRTQHPSGQNRWDSTELLSDLPSE